MRPRWSLLPCVAAFACLALGPVTSRAVEGNVGTEQKVQAHIIEGLGKDTVPLEGAWEFRLGDDPGWASPSLDDSQWTKITADQTWGAQGFYSYTGFAWYRYHLSIAPVAGAPKDLALLIPAIDDCYELYWNGILVGKNGKLPPDPTWYITQPPQNYGLGQIQTGVLAVRVWKARLSSEDPGTIGGFEGMPVLGGPDAIAAHKAQIDFKWLRSRQFEFGLNSLYALVALLSLLAWLRDRKEWLLLCMAGYTLMQPVALLIGGLRIPWPFSVALGLLQPVLMIQDVSLWFLLLLLLKLEDSERLMRVVRVWVWCFVVAFGLDGLVTMAWGSVWSSQLQVADAIFTVIFTPLEIFPIVAVITAVVKRKRLDSARWIVAFCAFVTEMIFVLRNASNQFVRFTHWTLSEKLNAPLFVLNGNPISPRVVANTLLLLSIVYAVYRYSIENRRQQAALEQEFKNARELQRVLIPETLPSVPGFSVTSAYQPAQQVGGDFFQIISLESGSTLVILGDVSGKGLRAAMAVSLIVGAVRALADDYPAPAQLLTQLNRRLHGRLQEGFATCLILQLSPDGACVLASAGHPAPYLNDREIELPGALPLGVSTGTTYLQSEFNVRAGDHFALYTDGLLEARRPSGELYGFDRLEGLFSVRTNAAEATAAAVNFGQDDDITVLTLTRLASGEEPVILDLSPSLQS
jgi:Stage II sporulation protein E (SpoIIE)